MAYPGNGLLSAITLVSSSAELVTSVTNFVLAIECVLIVIYLRGKLAIDKWRLGLWRWIFGLLAVAAFEGAIAHGLKLPGEISSWFYHLRDFCLGAVIPLFLLAALSDWLGAARGRKLAPVMLVLVVSLWGCSSYYQCQFTALMLVEALTLVSSLLIYLYMAFLRSGWWAALMVLGIALCLIAVAMKLANVSFSPAWPIDSNAIFHIFCITASAIFALGIKAGANENK